METSLNSQFARNIWLTIAVAFQVNDGKAAYKLRAAALAAGFPNTASASTVNRFCSSGLKATADIAHAISSGSIEVGIACGAELMSAPGDRIEAPFDETILAGSQDAKDCMQPMGWTSENVGRDFNISRESLDQFAATSYQRAERAQKEGWFDDEIVPITTKVKGPDGEVKEVTLTKDDGIRPGTTAEGLGKIRPAFPQWGPGTTGGNASQVTDGGMYSYKFRRLSTFLEMLTCFLIQLPPLSS